MRSRTRDLADVRFQAPEGPVPRPGQNEDFDLHCMQVIDENMFGDREAMQEMRR